MKNKKLLFLLAAAISFVKGTQEQISSENKAYCLRQLELKKQKNNLEDLKKSLEQEIQGCEENLQMLGEDRKKDSPSVPLQVIDSFIVFQNNQKACYQLQLHLIEKEIKEQK